MCVDHNTTTKLVHQILNKFFLSIKTALMKDFGSSSAYGVCVQNRVEMLVYLVNIFWQEGLYTWQTVVGVCGIEGVVSQLL